jgi:hypothetical protein
MASQMVSKSHFGGEAGGVRLANRGGKYFHWRGYTMVQENTVTGRY